MRKTSHRVGRACVLWLAAMGCVPTFGIAAAVVNLEWAVSFRPPGSSRCEPVGLAVEAGTGRSFVTGTNYPAAGTGAEFLTIACDRNGARLWNAAWNRPGNGNATPLALAFDPAANRLYLAGETTNRNGASASTALVAYDANGRQLWTRLENQAAGGGWYLVGMGLEPLTGNVHLLGADYAQQQTVCGYGIITWNNAGKRLWSAAYDGSPKGRWEPGQIAVDPTTGDVCVAGSACDYTAKAKKPTYGAALVAWDAAGTLLWTARHPGPEGSVFSRVAVDAATGAVYACGTAGASGPLLVAAYGAQGETLWTDTGSGAGSGRRKPVAMALDAPVGNLYITGTELDPATGKTAWFTLAYNLAGTLRWTARHAAGGSAGSGPVALAVDEGRACLYVTGRVAANAGSGAVSAIETIAYDASGSPLWTARYSDPGGAACYPVAIATDAAGNVYVAGATRDKAGGGAFLLLKYAVMADPDTDGDGLPDEWEQRYFGNLSRDGTGDSDHDGLTDSEEFAAGTNPVCADTDRDGMPDGWEVRHGLNPVSDDADSDADGDGVSSGTEYLQGRNPARGAVRDTTNAVALKLFTLLE